MDIMDNEELEFAYGNIEELESHVAELESVLRLVQASVLNLQEVTVSENRGYTRKEVDELINFIDAKCRQHC